MTITQIGFRNRSFIPAMTAVLAIFACTYDTAVAAESEAEFWLRYAESACNEIKNENAADRAFNRLHAINIQWGDVANAEKITLRIKNPEERVKAYIAIAKHYAESGSLDDCKRVLNQAGPAHRKAVEVSERVFAASRSLFSRNSTAPRSRSLAPSSTDFFQETGCPKNP